MSELFWKRVCMTRPNYWYLWDICRTWLEALDKPAVGFPVAGIYSAVSILPTLYKVYQSVVVP